ncbi:hypothetical protein [Profundibacter sp.]|uniref:hypothetical protein n=1 Tax=Profundibacter sp. TaxID=3101071 RepID=UPI003D0F9A42
MIVNMVMNAGNALLGTENCANLMSLDAATGQPTPITSYCITIFDPAPPVPVLDVVKTCEPAVQSGNIWNVDCTITVTGQNLPAGEVIRISDEMLSVGQNHAVMGQISQTGITSQCGGGMINTGFASSCDISTDDLTANGGTMVFDFSGAIDGPGGFKLGQNGGDPKNCAYADIASAGIHGPKSNARKLVMG